MIIFHILILSTLLVFARYRVNARGGVQRVSNPLIWLVVLYLLSAVAALFIDSSFLLNFDFSKYKDSYYLTYTFFTVLTLLPVLAIKGFKLNTNLDFQVTRVIWAFYLVCSLLIWFSLFYQLPYALTGLSLGAVETRLNLNVENESILPVSWLTTVSVVVSSFYMIFAMLFFVALIKKLNKFFIISMFVGGGLYAVSALAFMARDGALFCIISFAFLYSVFKEHLSPSDRRKFSKIFFICGAVLLVLLASITAQRFYGDGDSDRLINGTLGYVGQQPYVFVETIVSQHEFYGFSLRLPLLQSLIGTVREVMRTEVYEWTFGTFLKDFYAMYGWSTLLLFSLFLSFSFVFVFRRRARYHPLAFMVLLIFYFHFMSTGIFYFRLGSRAGNLYLVGLVVLFYLCRVFVKPKSHIN